MRAQPLTDCLLEWVDTCSWDRLPVRDKETVLSAWLDTVAVTLIGATTPVAKKMRNYVESFGASDEALIWGTNQTTTASLAAFANGVAGHALDYDDFHQQIHGHPSCVMFPALMAIGESRGLSGESLLSGYAAGLGVMAMLSHLFGDEHYVKGWHPTSSIGTFGAAVGVAKAIGMKRSEIEQVLSIASSFASGSRLNFGTMMKPVHAGWAARSGIEAVLLSESGINAGSGPLDSPIGPLRQFGNASAPIAHLEQSRDHLISVANESIAGIMLKPYPSCGGTHFGINASIELRSAMPAEEVIVAINVSVPRGARTALIYDDPQTGLEAKFSLPYAIALAIAKKRALLADFHDNGIFDPAVRDLMGLMSVHEDISSADTSGDMDGRFCSLSVETKSGQRYSAGCDVLQTLSEVQLRTKFSDCLSESKWFTDADAMINTLVGLPFAPRAETIMATLRRTI